ncbi:MAG TPA: multidrug ABC transporter ATP-binding protein, partial [Pseudomonas sp.]|nr:multidrug ABC transporter ATP-binding protein [Pseudomonas sp.]
MTVVSSAAVGRNRRHGRTRFLSTIRPSIPRRDEPVYPVIAIEQLTKTYASG